MLFTVLRSLSKRKERAAARSSLSRTSTISVRGDSPQKGALLQSSEPLGGGDSGREQPVEDEGLAEGINREESDENGTTTTDKAEVKLTTDGSLADKVTRNNTVNKSTTRPAVALEGKSLTSGVVKG